MRILSFQVKVIVMLLAVFPVFQARAGEKPKIAVMGLRAAEGLNKNTVKLLDELLLTEIQKRSGCEVLGSADITSMMRLEEERVKVTGCVDDSCLAEIGGALGVNLMVASSVGAVGNRFLLNVKLLDVKAAKVLKRYSKALDNDKAKLIDAIGQAAAAIVAGIRDEKSVEVPKSVSVPVAADKSADEEAGGFLTLAPWLSLGLAVAAGVAGGTLVGLGASDESKQEGEFFGTPEWQDLKESGETKYTAGSVLLGVAGAAGIGTLILFLVEGDSDAGHVSAALLPGSGGASLFASFSW
ncbi:MAG: hypothetical protein GXP49_14030 [Deltaproteobacteria bacterium]|nr:hypothetical protein [Deltaproteobacteria bacterium]